MNFYQEQVETEPLSVAQTDFHQVLGDISLTELKNASVTLGLKNTTFDLTWENNAAQLQTHLQQLMTQQIDTTPPTILYNMLYNQREDVKMIRSALQCVLQAFIEDKNHTEMIKRKKLEASRAKANLRAKENKKRKMDATPSTPLPNIDQLINDFVSQQDVTLLDPNFSQPQIQLAELAPKANPSKKAKKQKKNPTS